MTDVFEGASLPVATWLSVASKAAGLVLLLRLAFILSGESRGFYEEYVLRVIRYGLGLSDKHLEYAREVAATLRQANIRVHLDDRNEKLNARIRDAQLQKVPFMLVVGDREA